MDANRAASSHRSRVAIDVKLRIPPTVPRIPPATNDRWVGHSGQEAPQAPARNSGSKDRRRAIVHIPGKVPAPARFAQETPLAQVQAPEPSALPHEHSTINVQHVPRDVRSLL